jgi:ABC-type bacteriocin/lantibiotic exporter with double-glycine peptidase domain
MKIKEIKQLTQTECGTCCVLMILRYYKSKESMKEVQDELDAGRDGVSIKQIKNYFIKKKLDVKIFEVQSIQSISQVQLPCILYWNNNHYVVLEKIKKDKYEIVDPAEGRKKLSENEFLNSFSKVLMQIQPTNEFVPLKKQDKSPWIRIIRSMLKNKMLLCFALLSLVVTYILTLCVPIVVKKIVNSVSNPSSDTNMIYYLLLALFLTFIITSIFKGFKITQLNIFLSRILEKDTFKQLLHLPYRFFETRPTGDILYRISSTSAVKELITSQLIAGFADIGSLIVIFIYMLVSSIKLSILSLVLLSLNFFILFWFQPKLRRAIDNEILAQSKAQSVQVETLYSIDSIKISGIEKSFLDKWNLLFEESLVHFYKRNIITNINSTLISSIQIFSPILIFLIGIQEVRNNQMDLGGLVAFQTISAIFFSNGNSIFGSYTQLILTNQYLTRVTDIWETKEEERKINGLSKTLEGNIQIKNLNFSYSKNSSLVIKNISLEILPGQKIAFVGASGSGKSTLSKVMLGLYQPTGGTILFDGHSIENYNMEYFRKQIATVPQNAMLFNKTIKDNIVLNNEISMDELVQICKIACIYDEIMEMPMNFHTAISEFGMNISGGQRQRILLARALVQKPKIILLDESTSSLDSINEAKIMQYLSNMGCTVIHIAHRLSTIKEADNIFIFESGEMKEFGTHEELMKTSTIYNKLYNTSIPVL